MIYIEGGTVSQKQLAKDLYSFCIEALNIKSAVDIDLRIQDVKDAQAWIDYEGEGKFYIDIEQDLTNHQFITTICHEMVHVAQYLRDEAISEKEAYQLEVDLAERFKLIWQKTL